MKRILVVPTVVRIVIDTVQHQTFLLGTEEQVLVRVRPDARGNGVHLTVDGPHRILGCALLESLDLCHLHARIQGGLLCKQGGTDDFYFVIRVWSASRKLKRVFASHQSYLDIDAIDQELSCKNRSTWRRPIISTTRLSTSPSSSHEPCISRGSVDYFDGIHVSGRVLVPQLTGQLRDLGIVAVTQ